MSKLLSFNSDFERAFAQKRLSTLRAKEKLISDKIFDLSDAYCCRLRALDSTNTRNDETQIICAQPDRVLDAPGLVDDFYLNVLDWSSRNILAIALGPSVYLWNALDGAVKELYCAPSQNQAATSLAWIKDGRALAIGMEDGTTSIWDAETSRRIRTILVSPGARVASLAWNRHMLSTGTRNGAIFTHDVRAAKHLIMTHMEGIANVDARNEICGLRWSPDGKILASGSASGQVRMWMPSLIAGQAAMMELVGHRSAVKALAWSSSSCKLATGGGSADRTIRLWSMDGAQCIQTIDTGAQVSGLYWSRRPDELISVHGYDRNGIVIWGKQSNYFTEETLERTGNPNSTYGWSPLEIKAEISKAHEGRILHLAVSPDGRTLATAAADESIKFWNMLPHQGSPNNEKFKKL